jgi:hypothetical protein
MLESFWDAAVISWSDQSITDEGVDARRSSLEVVCVVNIGMDVAIETRVMQTVAARKRMATDGMNYCL